MGNRDVILRKPLRREWPAVLAVPLFVGMGALLIAAAIDSPSLLALVVGIALVVGGAWAAFRIGRLAVVLDGSVVEIRNRFDTRRVPVADVSAVRMEGVREGVSRRYAVMISIRATGGKPCAEARES